MRVEPDARRSAEERSVLARMTRSALERAGQDVSPEEAAHPAVVEAAHIAQSVLRKGPPGPESIARLSGMLARARSGIADTPPSGLPWPVGLAAPQPHLERSVARALKAVPRTDGDTGNRSGSAVVAWRERDTEVIRGTIALLADLWPGAYAELREILRQTVLLDGPALDGFTDFAVHGAVFIRRDRLGPDTGGLPGTVRLAEALVHEGTHTRCNAASVAAEPFLRPAADGGPLVTTPLRLDPRPLTGLFQQMVVLARSVLLYRRLLGETAADTRTTAAVRARHDELARSATEAVHIMTGHARALTDHGEAVLKDAAEVVRVRA